MFVFKKLFFYLLILVPFCVKAQQGPGQFVVSAGVGYSPEFNGQLVFISTVYLVPINPSFDDRIVISSILPNIGGTFDYGISRGVSIGVAGSYQSEVVSYNSWTNFSDMVSRTNAAVRFLVHLSKNNKKIDDYIGVRFGFCYWRDNPSSQNWIGPPYNTTVTFLRTPNTSYACLQVLYGIRLYMSDNIALHVEAGIGQPFLIESGLSYRFGNNYGPQTQSILQKGGYGDHPLN